MNPKIVKAAAAIECTKLDVLELNQSIKAGVVSMQRLSAVMECVMLDQAEGEWLFPDNDVRPDSLA